MPNDSLPMLEIDHVGKVYGLGTKREVEAVRDLHFTLREGEFTSVVGPSGSGKTTLLKIISGLLDATTGQVRLAGKVVSGPPEGMAVVFQEYGRSLFPWMTVEKNVELPLKVAGVSKAEREERIEQALTAVSLPHARKQYPWQLSGGMQQRVAIARAVAARPRVLLMDEPFAAVDAQTRAELEDLVRSVWAQFGMTVLFVTHDIDESVYVADRVLVLSSSPTIVQDEVLVDLPLARDQLESRSDPRFAQLRKRVYEQVQFAKTNPGGERSLDPDPVTRRE